MPHSQCHQTGSSVGSHSQLLMLQLDLNVCLQWSSVTAVTVLGIVGMCDRQMFGWVQMWTAEYVQYAFYLVVLVFGCMRSLGDMCFSVQYTCTHQMSSQVSHMLVSQTSYASCLHMLSTAEAY